MSDEADNVIRFPIERILEVPAPTRGYCSNCRVEMDWPNHAAWPQSCPSGCAPLVIQSYLPEPGQVTWGATDFPPHLDQYLPSEGA